MIDWSGIIALNALNRYVVHFRTSRHVPSLVVPWSVSSSTVYRILLALSKWRHFCFSHTHPVQKKIIYFVTCEFDYKQVFDTDAAIGYTSRMISVYNIRK